MLPSMFNSLKDIKNALWHPEEVKWGHSAAQQKSCQ